MKIEFYEIEGVKYPLSFSLAASEQLFKRYKNINKTFSLLKSKDYPTDKKMAIVCDILASLIYSGCQYYNAFHKAPYENAPFENGRFYYITAEQLKVSIVPNEASLKEIAVKAQRCIESSNKKELGTKPIPIKSKKKNSRRN